MNETLISSIQRFTLEARHNLEREVDEQLEGLYGWLPDGTFSPASHYPALAQLEAARETRRRLEAYVSEERDAGFDARAARRKLVRESSFSWLNRIVALHMMEERRLIKITVSRLAESNAYLFWLADEKDPSARKLHDQGEMPLNPLGEGPRHIAYRRFILWQCAELAREVSVLFDPGTLASCLFPRPIILKSLIESMNVNGLKDAWKPGNEEVIGWIYEAFIAEEKAAVFEAFGKGKKVNPEQIAPATQIFTPRWVVRFLVENSLGRLWIEMHPDTRLKKILGYLVSPPSDAKRSIKLASEITFLDPACGSMHFGLLAFDIFVEMYHEELDNAGRPGWPKQSSVTKIDDIPAEIIKNNIHGIDLDLRAVQLSALTLFLKARALNPTCLFTDNNLACANIEQITGGRLEEFIQQSHFDHPIYERILRSISAHLRNSDTLGSLLRPDIELDRLITEERKQAEINKKLTFALPGFDDEQFKTDKGLEKFFHTLQDQILSHLDLFVRQSREIGRDPSHFAAEAAKGLRFLGLVQHRYDVVTTNPPYMHRRNQSDLMAQFLDDYYPDTKTDLYAAFIERCVELTGDAGQIAMITQQSFMFISSYEKHRTNLLNTVAIETMAHLGPKAFEMVTGEKVNTTAFVVRREPVEEKRSQHAGVYFRLVREPSAKAKNVAFESAITSLHSGKPHRLLFTYLQHNFGVIPGKPWIYWMPAGLITLFSSAKFLRDIAPPAVGQNTGDNERFLRFWWEIPLALIKRDCLSLNDALLSTFKWFPYMKGGTAIPWWGNQTHVINWFNDAAEIKAYAVIRNHGKHWSRYIQNLNYCFRQGITWSDVSSKGFAARHSPGGFIHDVKGMACYPKEEDIPFVLALLNSRFAKFVLAALNPTISNQVGDIARLPVPSEHNPKIHELVNECIELTKHDSRESEITYEFIQPLAHLESVAIRKAHILDKESEVDHAVSSLYGLTADDLDAIDRELAVITCAKETNEKDDENGDEVEDVLQEITSPGAWAKSWLSYAYGIVLGRFALGIPNGLGRGAFTPDVEASMKTIIASDGILVNDSGQPLDMAMRVWTALQLMLGVEEAEERVNAAVGEGEPLEALRVWFDRFSGSPSTSFWKYHYQLYRKRPIYWPLQSPKRQYTVWVFHELLTRDTLFHIRNDIVEPRLRLAEREITDLRTRAEGDRRARKELDQRLDFSDDLREFSKRLKTIADRGYTPHTDDGVLLNAAPLYEILPSWSDTKAVWDKLNGGECEWAQQAMAYWPERVKDKCKTNSSYAIAHDLVEPEDSTKKTDEKAVQKRRGRSKRK